MFSSIIITRPTLFPTTAVRCRRSLSFLRSKVVAEGKKGNLKMTVTHDVRICNGELVVKGRQVLTNVPSNVISTSSGSDSGPESGIFIGASFDEASSRHVVSLGTFSGIRFMASFRFKLWWMAQKMGDRGSQIPYETQFLIIETENESGRPPVYTVFLPLVEGSFRACLQGNENDALELSVESGDFITKASLFTHSLFVIAGTDPFATITNAVRSVKLQSKTFKQRHEKKLPEIVDYFGWCTWDAFYQKVTQQGVEEGLQSLSAGGTPVKFVIIDDGWQSVEGDHQTAHPEPLPRLTGIKENSKFQIKDDPTSGINNIVSIAKQKHGLKHVYVWHAITGYWGGVRPGTAATGAYDSFLKYPNLSKGVMQNEPTWKTDVLALQGLGLVNPKNVHKFYDELHSYLASAGVDGVKVDVQCILETLGEGIGGRVELTKGYHRALDSSIAKNFPDNGCIACMSHNTDALYCSKQTAVIRASDDFYPRDPMSHTIHIASVAYNSLFLGEFMVTDWDMFHSLHPAAEYHASARAISGGPVYVSDAPGKHNFDVLRKLVLPDGSVLRALLPGRPTQDCLFSDPARDGTSLLKIWNMNKYTGVIGVYNCQGAAWNINERKNTFHKTTSNPITGTITPRDVHFISDAAADHDWNSGDCAVYCNRTGHVTVLQSNASLQVSLKVLEHEIYTVTPIKVLANGISFAPFGLINMYNAGGAVEELRYQATETENGKPGSDGGGVYIEVKGCGIFGAYSSTRARRCSVDSVPVDVDYDSCSGLLSFSLHELPMKGQKTHIIKIEF